MPSVEFHAVRIYPLHSAVTLADLQRAFSEHEKQVKRWHLSGFSMPDGVHHAWAIFRHLEDALSFRDRYDGMCDRYARIFCVLYTLAMCLL